MCYRSAEVKWSTAPSDSHRLLTGLQSITHTHTSHTCTYQGRSSTLHCLRICEWKKGLTHLADEQDFLHCSLREVEMLWVYLRVSPFVCQTLLLTLSVCCTACLGVPLFGCLLGCLNVNFWVCLVLLLLARLSFNFSSVRLLYIFVCHFIWRCSCCIYWTVCQSSSRDGDRQLGLKEESGYNKTTAGQSTFQNKSLSKEVNLIENM